jgi:hypothetical protein
MLLLRLILWCALGYAGGWIAARKGYPPRWGVVLGVLFGPLALLVCALLPMTEAGREQAALELQLNHDRIHENRLKECPQCSREVAFACQVCPRCDHRFEMG